MGYIITAQTAAKKSKLIRVGRNERVGIVAEGLTGVEEIPIKQITASGAEIAAKDLQGNAIVLSVDTPSIGLPFSGTYIADKPITSGAVAVSAD